MQEQPQPQPNKHLIIAVTILSTVLAVSGIAYFAGAFTSTPAPANSNIIVQAVDLKIKGNRSSKIYHLKGCPNYEDIAERNVVWFKTKEEAEAAGYRMAKNC